MDQEEADIDLIERRIRGDLSNAESKAFDARIANDLKFAEKVDDYIAIIKGIQNADSLALGEEVEAWEKELRETEKSGQLVTINPWRKYMIAAAVAAVLITTFVFINRPGQVNQQQLFTAYFVPYEDVLSVRDSDDTDESLAAAMELYNRKEYSEAIPHFLSYLEAQPQSHEAMFYLGISYLADEKASDAIAVLEQLESRAGVYADHVTWYLALADVLRESGDAAEIRLRKIVSDPNHDFYDKADQLLDELQ